MTKDTAEVPGVHLPWAGKLVRIEEIEDTLAYLWRMSADNVRISQNMNVRTCVLNLVICAPDIMSARRASTLLRDLSSTHIGRVTLLILDSSSSPAQVTTWVTLRSFPIISDIMRHSFEQITILLSGSTVSSASSIIQPLLKPDLPIYLWWLGDPSEDDATLLSLARISNRVIVDSNTFIAPEQGLCALSTFLQAASNCALSDLNWGRITPWRQLIAQFFDVPEYKLYLPGVYSIEIEHAVLPPGDAASKRQIIAPHSTLALLLAGWLKKSFNWQLSASEQNLHDLDSGTHFWHMSRHTGLLQMIPSRANAQTSGRLGHSGEGSISIRPRIQAGLYSGSLCLVRINTVLNSKPATFTIDREEDTNNVLTSVKRPEGLCAQRIVSVAEKRAASDLLYDELEILGHDHLYEDALHEVFELLAESQP